MMFFRGNGKVNLLQKLNLIILCKNRGDEFSAERSLPEIILNIRDIPGIRRLFGDFTETR